MYILFSISFMIIQNRIHLAYVSSQLGKEDLVFDYIFTSQRHSHSVPDMIFLLTFNYLSKIDLPKLTSSILMEIVTIPVVLVDEFYFQMHQFIKALLFEKVIFESLPSSYSLKTACILLRQVISLKKMVVFSVKFTILN